MKSDLSSGLKYLLNSENKEKTCSLTKSITDIFQLNNVMSVYAFSKLVTFPYTEKIQINLNTFVECLVNPEKPAGNILILQGGTRHFNSKSYYVKTACACSSMMGNSRVFLFEKLLPVINFDFAHDVFNVIKYIKKEYPDKPLTVVGYSMGGLLLYSYLSFGYDQADLYVPVCCPIDINNFYKTICDNSLFRKISNKDYKRFGVNGYKELLELSGTDLKTHNSDIKKFIPNLNKHRHLWSSKTVYIVSEYDPITENITEELKMLKKPPHVINVSKGWHCCLNSVYLSMKVSNDYISNMNIKAVIKNLVE